MDKVWELLKEVLPEFKLSEESISESKTIVIDSKVKEAGKEVKDGKEVKEGKEFRPEPSTTTLKLLEKSERFPKGKTFLSQCCLVWVMYINALQSLLN